MPKNSCIMQIWAESGKSALPICNYSQILYQFLTFTQNLKRSLNSVDFLILDLLSSFLYFSFNLDISSSVKLSISSDNLFNSLFVNKYPFFLCIPATYTVSLMLHLMPILFGWLYRYSIYRLSYSLYSSYETLL